VDKSPFGKGGKGDLKGTTLQQETFEIYRMFLKEYGGFLDS